MNSGMCHFIIKGKKLCSLVKLGQNKNSKKAYRFMIGKLMRSLIFFEEGVFLNILGNIQSVIWNMIHVSTKQ